MFCGLTFFLKLVSNWFSDTEGPKIMDFQYSWKKCWNNFFWHIFVAPILFKRFQKTSDVVLLQVGFDLPVTTLLFFRGERPEALFKIFFSFLKGFGIFSGE